MWDLMPLFFRNLMLSYHHTLTQIVLLHLFQGRHARCTGYIMFRLAAPTAADAAAQGARSHAMLRWNLLPFASSDNEKSWSKNPPGLGEEMMQNSLVLRGLLFFSGFSPCVYCLLSSVEGKACCFLTGMSWAVPTSLESCLRYAYQDPCTFHSCRWAQNGLKT